MALGSTVNRSVSVKYEAPNSASSSTSINFPAHHPAFASRNPKASLMRASTVTSATSLSKLIRSASIASTGRESRSASNRTGSTVRPPSTASRTSRASTARASTVTAATSPSYFVQSDSTSSIVRPPTSAPSASTTSLFRSGSKRAPSYFSAAASRLLWGRPPPGHSTLQPSHIASLTHILSLPDDTPMLCSLVGALGSPISRNQFSPPPSSFCDSHFWLEQRYIEELTEVIAHEIGPQLDKLRMAPAELISKKTLRILSILKPYKDIFNGTGITDFSGSFITSSSSSSTIKPTRCPACTLSHFFQNPDAVQALTTSVKGRKHRNRPWPVSMAWLEPCPGKGVDWDQKWKAEGKSVARDRSRVQRWRRTETRSQEQQQVPEEQVQILGHRPGEGCDFCDNLRVERADEEDLEDAIAEEGEDEGDYGTERLDSVIERETETETLDYRDGDDDDDDDDDDGYSDSLRPYPDDSETVRAMQEESLITQYMTPLPPPPPPSSSFSSSSSRLSTSTSIFSSSSTLKPTKTDSVYHSNSSSRTTPHNIENTNKNRHGRGGLTEQKTRRRDRLGYGGEGGFGEEGREKKKKRASEWARSYGDLVERL